MLISTPESQQPKPGWEWYQPTTISGLRNKQTPMSTAVPLRIFYSLWLSSLHHKCYVVQGGFNSWVLRGNPMVWPFKWKLLSSTSLWWCLLCCTCKRWLWLLGLLRCFDTVFRRPYQYFSVALKVILSLSNHYKIFSTDWLWIVQSLPKCREIKITMTTINKKLFEMDKSQFLCDLDLLLRKSDNRICAV